MQTQKVLGIIGTGRLGLCWALSLDKAGYPVLAADKNVEYVRSLQERDFVSIEPGVNEELQRAKNIQFTTDNGQVLDRCDSIFVLVPTPTLPDGSYNHAHINEVVALIEERGVSFQTKHFVIGSTVMPGFSDTVARRLAPLNWIVSYNPEFIGQGRILTDQENPDFILIGEDRLAAGDFLIELYKKVCRNQPIVHRMDRLSAEISKLSLNCFLTTKIAFANMIGDLAIKAGANPEKILKTIGSDSRVGEKFLKYGYGFGGPCLPRDNRALAHFSRQSGMESLIGQATDSANAKHLDYQIRNFSELNPVHIPIRLGPVSYSEQSQSIEESQQLAFAVRLAKIGYKITIVDAPIVIKAVKAIYGSLFFYEGCETEMPSKKFLKPLKDSIGQQIEVP